MEVVNIFKTASWGVGTAISSWGVGGSFAGPYGVLAGIVVGAGFQGMEYSPRSAKSQDFADF
ncbi:hypothetical protein [Flavobacterium collinsii]|uniref:Uncharacterized protein n=1 Tax=Flavobacterium collinsii TaxID=1114861 RepID=A0A9W4TF87_9FLAO|nr:hypothetical protein [Flavobacterium collinsii]CAI2765848.1 protein of unknown function [Flavobacterium collinsii]